MFGSEKVEQLIDEIEREHCVCGAGLNRTVPKTWECCGIHRRCEELRAAFRESQPIS